MKNKLNKEQRKAIKRLKMALDFQYNINDLNEYYPIFGTGENGGIKFERITMEQKKKIVIIQKKCNAKLLRMRNKHRNRVLKDCYFDEKLEYSKKADLIIRELKKYENDEEYFSMDIKKEDCKINNKLSRYCRLNRLRIHTIYGDSSFFLGKEFKNIDRYVILRDNKEHEEIYKMLQY